MVNANDLRKVTADDPMLKGHKRVITDFSFSPFNDNLLATASEGSTNPIFNQIDSNIHLWEIPEEGLTQSITQPDATLSGSLNVKLCLLD